MVVLASFVYWPSVLFNLAIQGVFLLVVVGVSVFLSRHYFTTRGALRTMLLTVGIILYLGVLWDFLGEWKAGIEWSWSGLERFVIVCVRDGSFFKYTLLGFFVGLFVVGFRAGLDGTP